MRRQIQEIVGDFAAVADYCNSLFQPADDLHVEHDALPSQADIMRRQMDDAWPIAS